MRVSGVRGGPEAMTQEEYLLLNELIAGEIGVSFPEHKRDVLESRLRPHLASLRLRRYLDYYYLVQGGDEAERLRLAELVTNNETYFFRETQQFEALFETALDDLKAAPATPGGLRLLSAGCSSGEEVYTLSIIARQNFVRLAGTALTVDAFDIDRSRVEAARRAEYGGGSFRATTREQLERYFLPVPPAGGGAAAAAAGGNGSGGAGIAAEARYTVKPFFQGGLRFNAGNILDLDTFAAPIAYDAVFCRNVFIYFSEPALHRAVANFAAVLRRGGLLFLGHAESIIGLSTRFETVRLRNLIAYRKVKD
jgi:chemotaxis protein methyltransferase CheR